MKNAAVRFLSPRMGLGVLDAGVPTVGNGGLFSGVPDGTWEGD